jgi:glycosyltransferase involved in cell wall biosynthesis
MPDQEPYQIVSCGRLFRGKGHQDLISAIGQLRANGVLAKLTIFGEGPHRGELEQLIQSLKLTKMVRLAGAVSEEQIREFYEISHLFSLASSSHIEAIPVAIMEAMSMQLPVVATHSGGVAELVRDGIDGILVQPYQPEKLATAIQSILQNPHLALRMGKSGSERIVKDFRSQRSAEIIINRIKSKQTV